MHLFNQQIFMYQAVLWAWNQYMTQIYSFLIKILIFS